MSERERLPETRPQITAHLRLLHQTAIAPPCSACGRADDPKVETLDLYVTVGLYEDGRPAEVFTCAGHAGSRTAGWLNVAMRLASVALQHSVPIETIVHHITGHRFEPSGRLINPPEEMLRAYEAKTGERRPWIDVTSPADAVGKWLEAKFISRETP